MTVVYRMIMISALVAASIACTKPSPPPLALGTGIWLGYEPVYLARELGLLSADQVRLVEFGSTTDVMKAFRNELLDAAMVTLDESLQLLAQGERLKIVLVVDVSGGGDAILGQPYMTAMSDLKGKRVGLESSALGAYVLTRALDIHHLARSMLTLVPLEVDSHYRAFQEQQVDAVVTFEPTKTRLQALGAKVLFDSRELPGEIVDILVVHERVMSQQARHIAHLVDAWYQALDYLNTEPEPAANIMSKRHGITPQALTAGLAGLRFPNASENQQLIQGTDPDLLPVARRLASLMLDAQLIDGAVAPERLFGVGALSGAGARP